jgi:hypothetical protein
MSKGVSHDTRIKNVNKNLISHIFVLSFKIGAGSSPNAGWPTDVGPSQSPKKTFRAWLKDNSVIWVILFFIFLILLILPNNHLSRHELSYG